MNTIKIALSLMLLFSNIACANRKTNTKVSNETVEIVDMHVSENSLDWQGSYTGTLPCADCEGIYTILTLNEDQSYTLTSTYLGEENETAIEKGSFEWREDGSIILIGEGAISENNLYQVVENKILKLDAEGMPINGPLSEFYKLNKLGTQLADTYWKLTALKGAKISNEISSKEIYIQFKSEDNQVMGNGGCNNYYGNYQLTAPLGIKLSDISITEMACAKQGVEQELMQVLNEVDNYTLINGILSLNKSKMASLAKFEAKPMP